MVLIINDVYDTLEFIYTDLYSVVFYQPCEDLYEY